MRLKGICSRERLSVKIIDVFNEEMIIELKWLERVCQMLKEYIDLSKTSVTDWLNCFGHFNYFTVL